MQHDPVREPALSSYEALRGRHICFVVNADWFFLSHRLPLAQAAVESGARVTVVAGDSGCAQEIRRHGIQFVPLPISRPGLNPFRELITLASLVKTYRALRPDLVHHVTLKPVVYGSMAARCSGHPAIVNAVSGMGYAFSDNRTGSLLQACLERLLAVTLRSSIRNGVIIVQNSSDRSLFLRRGWTESGSLCLIRGSGVDLKRFRARPEPVSDTIVLLPARMLWEKGIGDFVAAARLLKRRGFEHTRFVLVGRLDPGNRGAISQEQLRQWVKSGDIEWWGMRRDMPAVYAQSSVVVLPTFYGEGLPKVLLEAAACRRAIVATDVPGCREFVGKEDMGLMVQPRSPEALADAIAHLLDNPNVRSRLAEEAYKHVRRSFTIEDVIAQTMNVYTELLGTQSA